MTNSNVQTFKSAFMKMVETRVTTSDPVAQMLLDESAEGYKFVI